MPNWTLLKSISFQFMSIHFHPMMYLVPGQTPVFALAYCVASSANGSSRPILPPNFNPASSPLSNHTLSIHASSTNTHPGLSLFSPETNSFSWFLIIAVASCLVSLTKQQLPSDRLRDPVPSCDSLSQKLSLIRRSPLSSECTSRIDTHRNTRF